MLSLRVFSNFFRSASISTSNQVSAALNTSDLPQAPKKPVTPWIAFVRDRKDSILSQKDRMTAAEMSVILAKEWKQTDKTRYEEAYKRQQQEYHQKKREYFESLTQEQKDALDMLKDAKRHEKATKQIRKTKPPTLPRNPANLYCHVRSQHEDIKAEMKRRKASDVFKDIFREYRELPEEEKKKYIEMQEHDKQRFQHEFLSWYEGIQENEFLSKTAREKAEALRERYSQLKYI